MANDAFGKELKLGDIVVISSTSYAELHIGVITKVNKNATVYRVSKAADAQIYKERIGSTTRLASINPDYVEVIAPGCAEILLLAQHLILSGKGKLFQDANTWNLSLAQLKANI